MTFKTKPYEHQIECYNLMHNMLNYAILLEQGLGKTKIALDDAARLFFTGKIDGLLIIAPNGVHSNWSKIEIPIHLIDECDPFILEYSSSVARKKTFADKIKKCFKHEGLKVLVMNVEAFSTSKHAILLATSFLKEFDCCMVLDESSRIKTPKSKRTKNIMKLGKLAKYKRIMTGTPVTQSPFDVFSQFFFLDPKILGFYSFVTFKHHFGIFETEYINKGGKRWSYETLTKYVRLPELSNKIDPYSYRRTKKECLDLPDIIYQTVLLELTPQQKKLYNDMDEEGLCTFDDLDVIAPSQLVKLLRLQQITGGFLSDGEDNLIPLEVNPKLKYLIEAVKNDYIGKTIIWARFRFEIAMIVFALQNEFGHKAITEVHGGVIGSQRTENVATFQENDKCKFLIGQQQSGIGITLTKAEYIFYYSNPFSYEQRYQSEDRSHRIGTERPPTYIDLIMKDTVDERVVQVLKKSKRLADIVTGDKERLNDK